MRRGYPISKGGDRDVKPSNHSPGMYDVYTLVGFCDILICFEPPHCHSILLNNPMLADKRPPSRKLDVKLSDFGSAKWTFGVPQAHLFFQLLYISGVPLVPPP